MEADDAWPGEAPPPVTAPAAGAVGAAAGEENEAGKEELVTSVGPMPFMSLRKRLSVGAEGGAEDDKEKEGVEVVRGALLAAAGPILRTRRGLLPTAVWKGCVCGVGWGVCEG